MPVPTSSMSMSLKNRPLTSWPRSRLDLMRMPWSVPLKWMRSARMFWAPPANSLPMDRPWPWRKMQSVMVMSRLGSSGPRELILPDLMATLSSPTSAVT